MAENDSDLPDKNLPPEDSKPKEPTPPGADLPEKLPPPPPPPAPRPPEPKPEEPEAFKGLFGSGGILGSDDESGDDAKPVGGKRQKKKLRSEMGFFEHLEELRMTILKSAFAAAIGMGFVGLFFVKFLDYLKTPYTMALVSMGQNPNDYNNLPTSGSGPMDTVMMTITASIYGGVILMLPVIAYFVVRFVAPGLTFRERGMLRPTLVAAVILFFTGALVCFYIMLPAGFKFSLHLNNVLGYRNMFSASDIIKLVVWATLATGLMFEFPLILVILQILGVIETQTLRSGRRYAILIIAIIGGLLAPSPDVASMLMMMAPMILLYEGAIIVGGILRRRRVDAQAKKAAQDATKDAG